VPDIRAALEAAIRDHELAAADALMSIQLGAATQRIDFEGLRVAAQLTGRAATFQAFVVEQIAALGLMRPFTVALAARGAALPDGWEAALAAQDKAGEADEAGEDEAAEGDGEDDESDAELRRSNLVDIGKFEDRARALRCRIFVNGNAGGSGFLVGPSTVMTAWHVIAPADGAANARIEVALADGQRIPAFLPIDIFSKCSASELASRLPANDDEVADLHDVAVLTLKRPAGAALGIARLADDPQLRSNDTAIVAHFPEGKDFGLGVGGFRKLRGLTSRWGHTAKTRAGSSGAACFDATYRVVGVHQGRLPASRRGRLVPVNRFPKTVLDRIARDEAPPALWSLDGTVEGALVVGRQAFFQGFAAASRASTRVRGIRIKRVDAAADLSGIPFSYLMLEQMVARAIDTRVLRISFESVVHDLADEIARRAADIGLDIGEIAAAGGVGASQSTPEAVAADRSRRAAAALDALAGTRGLRLWIFLEHPSVVFGDELRAAFEGFIDHALRAPNLRLVVAGYEAVSIPGLEFGSAAGLGDDGLPGLLVEYIEGFTQGDVEALIRGAAAAFGRELSQDLVSERAEEALDTIGPGTNGLYDAWRAGEVVEALRPALRRLAKKAAGGARRAGSGNG
jgi:V8-like Glu-specific endopeptidase